MPGLGTSPYTNANVTLNLVRSLGNDAIQSLAGSLLNNNKPYVAVFLNAAYEYLQNKLSNSGYSYFKKRYIISGVPIVGVPGDPAMEVTISFTGTNDGVENFETPVLPIDIRFPIRLRERQTNTLQVLQPMFPARNGIISRVQNIWLRDWYWINNNIALRGATQVNDIELLYCPVLPDLVLGATDADTSDMLILRGENALAAYTLWEYALSRGSAQAPTILAMGDRYVGEMIASDSELKKRGNFRRQGYSQSRHGGWGSF